MLLFKSNKLVEKMRHLRQLSVLNWLAFVTGISFLVILLANFPTRLVLDAGMQSCAVCSADGLFECEYFNN